MIEVIVLDNELYTDYDLQPKTFGSAGLDLKLARDAKPAAQMAAEGAQWPYYDLIGTGLKVRVPTNMVGLIVPRSSAGHKHGFHIGNTIGVIDSDYRGELMMSIGGGDYGVLKRGAAVAQLILVPYSSFFGARRVAQFSDEDTAYGQRVRGDGGFGSTDAAFRDAVTTGTGAIVIGHVPTDFLLDTTRSVLGDARHEAGCQQCDEYQRDKLNGGF